MSLTELGYSGICPRVDNHGSFANPAKCYKLGTLLLVTSLFLISNCNFLKIASTHLRGHELKIYKPRSQLDVRIYFSITVIDEWSTLPGSVIHSNTVNTFKAKIDYLFKKQDIYIYKLLASFLLSHLF